MTNEKSQASRKRSHADKAARYLRIPQAADRYNIGVNTLRRIATEADAVVRFGRTTLIDTKMIDGYLESLRGFAVPIPK